MSISLSDPYLLRAFNGLGKWSRVLAIVSFVALGLFALVFLFALGTIATVAQTLPGFEAFGALGTAGLGVFAVLYIGVLGFLTYKFYRFAKCFHRSAERGLTSAEVEEGFSHLTTLLKISVAFTLIGLVLVVVLPLLALAGVAAAAG